MKPLLLTFFLLFSIGAGAQTLVTVDSGSTDALGIGGNAQLGWAFAKGDVVTIEAKASKQLERMLIYRFPQEVIGRVKLTRKPKLTFTMPEEGVIICRFISDRDGTNNIAYTVTRIPASAAVQDYDTKVDWQVARDRNGGLVPKRVPGD
jgi:hypothetical protein